jgi:MFS family permease
MKFLFGSDKRIVFALLCLGNVAISFNIGAVAASIPMISHDLQLPDFVTANIVPAYMIPYGIGALLYAHLSRVINYKRILIAAMFVYAVMSFFSGISQSLIIILLAQLFAGVAAACSTPLSLMIIGEFFDKDVRGRLIGIYFGSSFLSSLVGMIAMGIIHWRWLFFIPAIIGLISAFSFFSKKAVLLNRRHKEEVNYWRVFSHKPIRNIFGFIFIMSFLYHAVHKWYGVYLHREYGMDSALVSVFLVFAAASGLAGQQIGGYLSDKKGRIFACKTGVALLAGGVTLLWGFYQPWFLAIILGMIAVGWTVSHNSVSTILTDFPDEDRPMISSLNSSVRFVSGGLGFSMSKFLVEKSFSLTFLGIGIIMFFMMLSIKHVMPRN